MITESDFDDLIDIDRADRRRYAALAGLAVLFGIGAAVAPQVAEIGRAFSENAGPAIARISGVLISAIGAQPASKYIALSRNMDRLDKIRRRWRRLKDAGPDGAEGVKQIETMLWDAYR